MHRLLLPHQDEALAYGLSRNHPAFLMEMRLGKTLVNVRLFQKWDIRAPHLVLGPSKVFMSWEKELHLEGETFIRAYATTQSKRFRAVSDAFRSTGRTIVLLNNESLTATPQIGDLNWPVVDIDESAKLRNPRTKISRLVNEKFRSAEHRIINTGLVAPESLLDIFQQFRFLHNIFMGYSNYWDFRSELFTPGWSGYSWHPSRENRRKIKKVMHEKAFVKTRKDAGITIKKIYTPIRIEMNAKQRKLYNEIEKHWEYETKGAEDLNPKVVEALWATEKARWLTRIAGGFSPDGQVISSAKVEEIYDLLTGELRGEKAVVFYRYRDELAYDFEYLSGRGIYCTKIHGAPMSTDRRMYNEKLFTEGKARVLLCTIKSVDLGKDFSISDVAIYRSNEPSCELRVQSEDRILHILKTNPLYCIDLITADSCDEELAFALVDKKYNAKELMVKMHMNHIARKLGKLLVAA